ncbi:hypothetical protein TEA_023148 [Camellia sinensis var. sinensis]|uniref:Uncharacterized protein n=1 Tax=Camellia sinensis var. sinensis TaxID=542762 RepID=A0A4S4F1P0_CAMSN|nr:hypothetical protein TEA_023148 [Camellia sinensis var. sinensis]
MGACASVHKDSFSNMKFRLSFGSKTDKVVIPSPIHDRPIVNGDRPIADGALKSQRSPSLPVRDFGTIPVLQSRYAYAQFIYSICCFVLSWLVNINLSNWTLEMILRGSKGETFFDSQPWLESDCEDDFFSVNGDFTPSRGNTPVHQSSSAGTPQGNSAFFDDKTTSSKPSPSPSPSPTDGKKKLAELFRDSLKGDQDVDDPNIPVNQNVSNGKVEAKTTILGLPPRSEVGTHFVSGPNSVCSSERTLNGVYRDDKEKPMKSVQCCLPRMLSSRSFSERKKKMESPARSIG